MSDTPKRPVFWMPPRDPNRPVRNMSRELADHFRRAEARATAKNQPKRPLTAREMAAEADGVETTGQEAEE